MRIAIFAWLLGLACGAAVAAEGPAPPDVAITSPESFSYFKTPDLAGPGVDVAVEFQVSNWMYPGVGKAVVFLLDGVQEPPFASTQAAGHALLTGVSLGQHTITACLAVFDGQANAWELLPEQIESACHSIVVNVALIGCYPAAFVPAEGQVVCDRPDPRECCFDTNPCSVDSCTRITLPGGGDQYECRYGPSSDPLCCHTADECHDCLENDTQTGSCLAPNLCTWDACVDHHCVFDWNPFHGLEDGTCCQHDLDCDDGDPATIDACDTYVCTHQPDPLYCGPSAAAPGECPASDDPCVAWSCNAETEHCDAAVLPTCCANEGVCCATHADCVDDDGLCTLDLCVDYACVHAYWGADCVDPECDDDNPCTVDWMGPYGCQNRQLPPELAPPSSGGPTCCGSDEDCPASDDPCVAGVSCIDFVCTPQPVPDCPGGPVESASEPLEPQPEAIEWAAEASEPGAEIVEPTPEISELALEAMEPVPDVSEPGPDEVAAPDPGTTDTPSGDPGPAGADGATIGDTASGSSGGGSCTLTGPSEPRALLPLLLVLVVAARRRARDIR